MIFKETKRLICKSEMAVINGLPKASRNILETIDLKNIEPLSGMEFGFMFYDKTSNEHICQIHFEEKRKEYEISYGTKELYRGKGYMQEALEFFVNWVFENTCIECLYALINNNAISQHILEKNGFEVERTEPYGTWFVRKKSN